MPAYKLIPIGTRFGLLTVTGEPVNGRSPYFYPCSCDCGKQVVVSRSNLVRAKSCGCGRTDSIIKQCTTHGDTGTRLYRIWLGLRNRCNNKRDLRYADYGGRGIRVSQEFQSFEAFKSWALANGYRDDLTIDRINNDGDYSISNCRWATVLQQNRNSRHTHQLEHDGKNLCLSEWAEITGIRAETLRRRLNLGWSVDRTLITALQ